MVAIDQLYVHRKKGIITLDYTQEVQDGIQTAEWKKIVLSCTGFFLREVLKNLLYTQKATIFSIMRTAWMKSYRFRPKKNEKSIYLHTKVREEEQFIFFMTPPTECVIVHIKTGDYRTLIAIQEHLPKDLWDYLSFCICVVFIAGEDERILKKRKKKRKRF